MRCVKKPEKFHLFQRISTTTPEGRLIVALARIRFAAACLLSGMLLASCGVAVESPPVVTVPHSLVEEKSLLELQNSLASGTLTSEQLVRIYLHRTSTIDRSGAHLQSVLAVNPDALRDARARDAERRQFYRISISCGALPGGTYNFPIAFEREL